MPYYIPVLHLPGKLPIALSGIISVPLGQSEPMAGDMVLQPHQASYNSAPATLYADMPLRLLRTHGSAFKAEEASARDELDFSEMLLRASMPDATNDVRLKSLNCALRTAGNDRPRRCRVMIAAATLPGPHQLAYLREAAKLADGRRDSLYPIFAAAARLEHAHPAQRATCEAIARGYEGCNREAAFEIALLQATRDCDFLDAFRHATLHLAAGDRTADDPTVDDLTRELRATAAFAGVHEFTASAACARRAVVLAAGNRELLFRSNLAAASHPKIDAHDRLRYLDRALLNTRTTEEFYQANVAGLSIPGNAYHAAHLHQALRIANGDYHLTSTILRAIAPRGR